MDKIYFTTDLLNFRTRKFPEKAIIINLQKYENIDIENIIEKLNIYDIYCENKSLQNKLKDKYPQYEFKLIDQIHHNIHCYHNKDWSYFILNIVLATVLTLFLLNWVYFSWSVLLILIFHTMMWILTYSIIDWTKFQTRVIHC